ncbi:MAG: hypothetical protein R2873_06020 [Caldilineaceae bacterium]
MRLAWKKIGFNINTTTSEGKMYALRTHSKLLSQSTSSAAKQREASNNKICNRLAGEYGALGIAPYSIHRTGQTTSQQPTPDSMLARHSSGNCDSLVQMQVSSGNRYLQRWIDISSGETPNIQASFISFVIKAG